jgi:hypothetical protein
MRPRLALALAALLGLALALPGALPAAPKKKKPATREAPVNFDKFLPVFGTRLAELPQGPMKSLADTACLTCHAADMVVQQHLTEKQWAATVTKMAGWGAAVPEDKKSELVAYLVKNFGPENTGWQPVATRPMGR